MNKKQRTVQETPPLARFRDIMPKEITAAVNGVDHTKELERLKQHCRVLESKIAHMKQDKQYDGLLCKFAMHALQGILANPTNGMADIFEWVDEAPFESLSETVFDVAQAMMEERFTRLGYEDNE